MKKFSVIAIAVMLVLGLAGYAAADIGDWSLYRVVYTTNANAVQTEVMTDLGQLGSDFQMTNGVLTQSYNHVGPQINLNQFTGSSWSDLKVAYFAIQGYASGSRPYGLDYAAWVSSTGTPTANYPGTSYFSYDNFSSAYAYMQGAYGTLTKGNSIALSMNNSGYFQNMDQGKQNNAVFGVSGYASGLIGSTTGEVRLASTDVNSILYYLGGAIGYEDGTVLAGAPVLAANITTTADGYTNLGSATATPIPPSVFLLGSGLIGLVPIRRRFKK